MDKLNIGSGDHALAGWVNVDLESGDVRHDLSVYPWPFKDNSADVILASHVLEHFDRIGGMDFLRECHRILRRNGLLYLAVPDMDLFIDCKVENDWTALGGYTLRSLDWMMGGDWETTARPMQHRYMYCEGSLSSALLRSGFLWPTLRNYDPAMDTKKFMPISLYMQAQK